MATINLKNTAARISFKTGMTDDGKVVKKTKTYQNITKDADVTDLYNGLEALASLSAYTLIEVERIDTSVVND